MAIKHSQMTKHYLITTAKGQTLLFQYTPEIHKELSDKGYSPTMVYIYTPKINTKK